MGRVREVFFFKPDRYPSGYIECFPGNMDIETPVIIFRKFR